MEKNVQFSDDKQTEIIAVFSSPQDVFLYKNQGVVDISDVRYTAFIDKLANMLNQ